MSTYTGTLTGSGVFKGTGALAGVTEDISQTDVVTADLTINSNGTFSGTEDQVITTTVTIDFPGLPSSTSTSTYDTGTKPVSGNVKNPYTTTTSAGGATTKTTWAFSGDHSKIDITGITKYNGTDISGSYNLDGALTAPKNKINLAIVLNGDGFGTITVTENGDPVAVTSDGGDQGGCAYDNLIPVRDGTYTLKYQPTGTSESPDLLFQNTPWATGVELHAGNNPGDSNGCIVTGNGDIDNEPNNNFWSGLQSLLKSAGSNASITATVSGETAQPELAIVPDQQNINQGQSDTISFEIEGGDTNIPLNRDIQVYFTVKSSQSGKTDFAVLNAATGKALAHGTGAYASDYIATIVGDHAHPPSGNSGDDSVSIVIKTDGQKSEDLTIKIAHYTGVRYPTKGGTKSDYNPSTQPMLQGVQPDVIPVNAATQQLVQAMATFSANSSAGLLTGTNSLADSAIESILAPVPHHA
jgi:hypothetical protein